ncbi:DUF6223 family protein [Pseudonocardia xinjiangensis]|uniref:DUF6223 family protein n=1 Tax=Pseudonocardia xinjiangensis TaxID=75289 RepID=UPI003D929B1D
MSVRLLLAVPDAVHVSLAAGGYVLGVGAPGAYHCGGSGADQRGPGRAGPVRSAQCIGTGTGRTGAITTLVIAAISVIVGGLHTANSASGPGTGNGLAGAVVALALGLLGLVLGGLALVRSRHLTGVSRHGGSSA